MDIINLTQHKATPEQLQAGVVDYSNPNELAALLTFTEPPTRAVILSRAYGLAMIARNEGAMAAMIGGAPYLMSALEDQLRAVLITPVYSFTARDSAEVAQPDGTVRKTAVFKHVGFVEVP